MKKIELVTCSYRNPKRTIYDVWCSDPVFAEFEREILSERVKSGIAQARSKGKTLGRPVSVANKAAAVRSLYRNDKLTKSEIARNLGISRTSVRRFLQMSR